MPAEIIPCLKPENKRFQDLTGMRFSRLTVLEFAGKIFYPNGSTRCWRCACDCGRIVVISGTAAKRANASCGCLGKQLSSYATKTHGMSQSPEYKTWIGMLSRCENPNAHAFESYGGRGITVCERWHKFEHFYEDMGARPRGLTLERRDNNLGYSKDNCYWATRTEQQRNRRNSRLLTLNGTTLCLTGWAEKNGVKKSCLRMRLKKGWPVERALSEPARDRPPEQKVTFNNQTMNVSAWERKLGADRGTIWSRLKRGWSIERAITEPIHRKST